MAMEVARAVLRCVIAVIECISVMFEQVAAALVQVAAKLKSYIEESVQDHQRTEPMQEHGGGPQAKQEIKEMTQGSPDGDDDTGSVAELQQSVERLTAPGRFYAVVKGTKIGLFQSWFVAANQVLNVPGSLQERFSSQKEALQFMVRYFQSIGWTRDIIEYDEQSKEVWRYRQRDFVM